MSCVCFCSCSFWIIIGINWGQSFLSISRPLPISGNTLETMPLNSGWCIHVMTKLSGSGWQSAPLASVVYFLIWNIKAVIFWPEMSFEFIMVYNTILLTTNYYLLVLDAVSCVILKLNNIQFQVYISLCKCNCHQMMTNFLEDGDGSVWPCWVHQSFGLIVTAIRLKFRLVSCSLSAWCTEWWCCYRTLREACLLRSYCSWSHS